MSETVRISFNTTDRVQSLLEQLALQGVWGKNASEVAERLVTSRLQRLFERSCFISYSHEDKVFARERLYDALRAREIDCWLDDHEVLPGDDLFDKLEGEIFRRDRVILCCSRNSLTSWWVENEIDMVLRKEKELMERIGKKVPILIPVDLDGFVFSNKNTNTKSKLLLSRAFADFNGWENDYSKFSKSADQLARAIHR